MGSHDFTHHGFAKIFGLFILLSHHRARNGGIMMIKYREIADAFDFVSYGMKGDHSAILDKVAGTFYWRSGLCARCCLMKRAEFSVYFSGAVRTHGIRISWNAAGCFRGGMLLKRSSRRRLCVNGALKMRSIWRADCVFTLSL